MEIKNAIPVSLLSTYLKNVIDSEDLLQNVRIYGEITDFSLSKNIAYFSLKDENALLSCVCFAQNYYPLIKNGAQVVLTGSAKFWVKGGRLSFQVSKVEDFGKGKAYLDFLYLKEKLEKEGLFDEKNKKPVPKFTKKIGVVSSKTGAVIRDICNVSWRRNPFVNIVLYPAQVQGEGAAKTVIEGVKYLDTLNLDVIVIARGGGSNEDLSAFNDEELARTIFAAKTPIVSAVGHETDFSISDFVADLRAPTPSAAAELITIDVESFFGYIVGSVKKISLSLWSKINSNLSNLKLQASKVKNGLVLNFENKKNNLSKNLLIFKNENEKLLTETTNKVGVLSAKFEKLNPLETLKRGFAKISMAGKNFSFEKANVGDLINISVYEGDLKAEIKEKKEK